jgi:hypothetical protein
LGQTPEACTTHGLNPPIDLWAFQGARSKGGATAPRPRHSTPRPRAPRPLHCQTPHARHHARAFLTPCASNRPPRAAPPRARAAPSVPIPPPRPSTPACAATPACLPARRPARRAAACAAPRPAIALLLCPALTFAHRASGGPWAPSGGRARSQGREPWPLQLPPAPACRPVAARCRGGHGGRLAGRPPLRRLQPGRRRRRLRGRPPGDKHFAYHPHALGVSARGLCPQLLCLLCNSFAT